MTLLPLSPLLLSLACSDGDVVDNGDGVDCELVRVEDCADTPGCTNAVASFMNVDPASGRECFEQLRQNAVCAADGSFGQCEDVETAAAPADAPDDCLLFTNSCTPPGWIPCSVVPDLTCPLCVDDIAPSSIVADVTVTGRVGLGRALAAAGDTNGDGYQDLLSGYKKGAVLLFGPFVEGERAVGPNDAVWEQDQIDDRAGTALAGLGDLDHDGVDDIAIGAPHHGPDGTADGSGMVYVFKGPLRPGIFSLADATIRLTAEEPGDEAGSALAFGRLTNDGLNDLVVAAPLSDANGANTGTIYVLTGPVGPGTTSLAEAGTKILGDAELGKPLTVADVDGDGIDDLVFGQDPASATVLYGPLKKGNVKAITGERITPVGSNATAVTAMAVGDVDNDGDLDLAWGSADDATNGSAAGAAWTVADPWGGGNQTVDATLTVRGRCELDEAGSSLTFGDVTGDGIDDLLVGGAGSDSARFGVAVFAGPVAAGEVLISEADYWLGDAPATALALMDLDNDGVLDIAAGNMDSETIYIWFGGGW